MKTETFKGTVESAYGKVLPSPVAFSGEFQAFETFDEVKSANEIPSNEDLVGIVNAKRKASARAAATTEALQAAGIAKPDPNSPDVIREQMVKMTMKLYPKLSETDARKIVEASQSAASAVA